MNPFPPLTLDEIVLRTPQSTDGYQLHQLVDGDPGLAQNSLFCNMLQCSHFAETSVAAVIGDELVGFISAYRPPTRARGLFVWQVVVAPRLRGCGLGKRMLRWLLDQPACEDVLELVAAISPENTATWKLFDSFARDCEALPVKSMLFSSEQHFHGERADQYLLTISPLPNRRPRKTVNDHLDDMRSYSMRIPGSRRWLD